MTTIVNMVVIISITRAIIVVIKIICSIKSIIIEAEAINLNIINYKHAIPNLFLFYSSISVLPTHFFFFLNNNHLLLYLLFFFSANISFKILLDNRFFLKNIYCFFLTFIANYRAAFTTAYKPKRSTIIKCTYIK